MKSDDDAVLESLPIRLTQPVGDSPSAARTDGDPIHPDEVYPTQPDMVHLYEVSWTIYGGARVKRYLSMAGIEREQAWDESWSNAGICPGTMAKLGSDFKFFPKHDFCMKLWRTVPATKPYPRSAKASRVYTLGGKWDVGEGDVPDCGWDVLAVQGDSEAKLVGHVHEETDATLHFYLLDGKRETLIDEPSTDAIFRWYDQDGKKRSSVKWRYEKSQVVETP